MIDKTDEKLISLLAKNGRATLNELAKQVNLSISPCQARIKRLEENKVKSEHYWVKDHSEDNDNNQLNRKRSHKRRRKVRKPSKGLR